MKINKPYTISESEKERIRGLHNKVKNLLREDSSEDESYHYGKDMGHDDKELYDLKHDGGGHIHMDDLEDDIHYDDEHDWGVDEELEEDGEKSGECGGAGQCSCKDLSALKKKVSSGRKGRIEEIVVRTGGCCFCGNTGGYQACPCTERDTDPIFETALPTGWTMKTLEEIEKENIMDDLYEVWLGYEDDKILRESMVDDGTIKELLYELPSRFGNKRLTESQLIRMIDTIIK